MSALKSFMRFSAVRQMRVSVAAGQTFASERTFQVSVAEAEQPLLTLARSSRWPGGLCRVDRGRRRGVEVG
jgi:hypothetical protein